MTQVIKSKDLELVHAILGELIKLSEISKDDYIDLIKNSINVKENIEFCYELLCMNYSDDELCNMLGITEDNIENHVELIDKIIDEIDLDYDIIKAYQSFKIISDFNTYYIDYGYDVLLDKDFDKILFEKKYDVVNKDHVIYMTKACCHLFDDSNYTFSPNKYHRTRRLNELLINADFDQNIAKLIEEHSYGWYSDSDSIDSQLSKVDMTDMLIEMKRNTRRIKYENLINIEFINKLKEEYPRLEFNFVQGEVYLEDQRNDSVKVYFNGDLIYTDNGRGNDFGDIRLNGKNLTEYLESNSYLFKEDK
ncbi:MAG: hypothetical protein WC136_04930 [Sphaerochaeta sp.]|jgi:hypothetical protein